MVFVPPSNIEIGVKASELKSYVQVALEKLELFTVYSELNKLPKVTTYILQFSYRLY